jgi:hypothetical protein
MAPVFLRVLFLFCVKYVKISERSAQPGELYMYMYREVN